ncbi:Diacylglycerol kinase (ATP) protein [Dioscorea alata]|uniref:Diacylglycerol kinase (ATP) protein n=1 Tax=Dioscorea alata TaxID=55571 RepID=A0ACB7WN71_DIOAL|nr:Diacylglycerol kinase (ATP) protein [Dioscorea alata]
MLAFRSLNKDITKFQERSSNMNSLTPKRSKRFSSFRSPPSMEIMTMAKPNQGGEIFHFSHLQHPLVPLNLPYLFTCMGCKEFGAGLRFRCQTCDFELHDFCALAPPSLIAHPFHMKHQLIFFTKPGGYLRSKCDICCKTVKGYAFHCTTCGFAMHPCCATMHGEMNLPVHEHPLISSLSSSSSSTGGDHSSLFYTCQVCNKKKSGLFFGCNLCGYFIHAICAKDMVNGLYVHGIKPPKKHNMLGTAAKLATHALFGIIGGLIEGIGEGIGEALIDSLGRSTRNRAIRPN